MLRTVGGGAAGACAGGRSGSAAMSMGEVATSAEPDRVDLREVRRDVHPGIAAVLAHPERAGGAAEGDPLAALVHVQRVTEGEVVGVLLGQTFSQNLPGLSG